MSLTQEQVPLTLEDEVREFLARRFVEISNELDAPSKFKERKEMPYKPQTGDVHYFGDIGTHNYDAEITSEGFWGLTNNGWTLLDISGKSADSELLDGIDGANYARSDIADTLIGAMTFNEIIDSDKGISFPATQVTSADANTLDDYEEDLWTPIMSDSSANDATTDTAYGSYTKIGRQIFFTGYILISSTGSLSGTVRIKGLPFVSENTINSNWSVYIGKARNFSITASESITGRIVSNDSHFNLNEWSASGGTTTLQDGEITNTSELSFSGFYNI